MWGTVSILAGMVSLVVAQVVGGGFDIENRLVDFGLLGLLAVGFLTERIVPGSVAKRERERADRMQSMVEEKMLPTQAEMIHATRESATATRDILDYLRFRRE